MYLKLTAKIPPSVNHYLAYRVSRGGKGKRFVQTYKTQDAISYEKYFKKYLEEEIKKQGWTCVDSGYVVIEVNWFFESNRRDSNNYYKVLLDCMNTRVFKDDKQALEKTVNIFIDSKNPRAEILIYKSDKIGVFQNKEEKQKFCLSNCHLCSKKSSSCSILKKLLDNRIIEEVDIHNNKCFKIKIRKNKKELPAS